jgi:hypothetical protein
MFVSEEAKSKYAGMKKTQATEKSGMTQESEGEDSKRTD